MDDRIETPVGDDVLPDVAEPRRLLRQSFLRDANIFLAIFLAQPAPNFCLRLRRADHIQPVAARFPRLRRDDGHDVPIGERRIQRHNFIIHLRADAVIPDLRVHAVREIDRPRALRQIDDITLRREDIDLVGEDVQLHRVHKFLRIRRVLPFQKPPEPGNFRVEILAARLLPFFVTPMRRDAVFRNMMHFPRADLDFHRLPARPNHRRVERLVHIRLRDGNVIFETIGQRFPERMRNAQDRIALRNRIHDDPHRVQIVNLRQILIVALHFFINGIEMLRPPRDGRLDARFLDLFVQDAHRIVDDFLARLPFLLHLPDQIRIRFRLQIVETEIFKLPFDIVNPQTMRERRVNFLRFLGDTNLLIAPEDGKRAHIVQTVRQFDQHDADIFGHRQKHFPEIFQLLVFFVLVMKLRELRHAVHERGDFFSEKRLDIRKRMLRILHDIVQKRRRDARGVHLELRQNVGDGQRMNDVRLPRLAFLRRVRLRRQRIRLLNHI